MFAWLWGRRSRSYKIVVAGTAAIWGLIMVIGIAVSVAGGGEGGGYEEVARRPATTATARVEDGGDIRSCIHAAHRAYEWRQWVKAQLDRPDTYDDDLRWRDVRTGMVDTEEDRLLVAILRESRVSDYEGGSDNRNVQVVGFNFSAENAYGAKVPMRTVGAMSPAPECRLIEMFILEGWF